MLHRFVLLFRAAADVYLAVKCTPRRTNKKRGGPTENLMKSLFVLGATLAVAMTTAFGGEPPTMIVVDEFGVGNINGAPLASGMAPDPFNGGALHLAYALPFLVGGPTPFDIVLFDPQDGSASDILRFVSESVNSPVVDGTTVGTILFFYSDGADGADAPADIFPLPATVAIAGMFTETGLLGPGVPGTYTEAGPNGFVYFAEPGAAGWDGNPGGTLYTFISDVPEPNSAALLLGGLGICLFILRLRRKAAQS
jgi:hypothetical protein